ncbi:hypothetical protein SB861_61605, partial [Paraburkholderia sp. SIMBA_049]
MPRSSSVKFFRLHLPAFGSYAFQIVFGLAPTWPNAAARCIAKGGVAHTASLHLQHLEVSLIGTRAIYQNTC